MPKAPCAFLKTINPSFVTNLRKDRDALDRIHSHNHTEFQEGTEDTAEDLAYAGGQ